MADDKPEDAGLAPESGRAKRIPPTIDLQATEVSTQPQEVAGEPEAATEQAAHEQAKSEEGKSQEEKSQEEKSQEAKSEESHAEPKPELLRTLPLQDRQ